MSKTLDLQCMFDWHLLNFCQWTFLWRCDDLNHTSQGGREKTQSCLKYFFFCFILGCHLRPLFLITPADTLTTLLLDWGEGEVMLFPLFPTTQPSFPRVITQCLRVSHCLSPVTHPSSLRHDISAHFKSLSPACLRPSVHSHSPAHESSEQISPWPFSPRARLFHPTDGEADLRPLLLMWPH